MGTATFPPPKSAAIFLGPKPGISKQSCLHSVTSILSLAKSPVKLILIISTVTGCEKDFAAFLHFNAIFGLAPLLEARKFLNIMRSFPQIRQVAAAITTSPRMVGVLAAAWHFSERLNAPLLLIHAGAPHAQKQAEFESVDLDVAGLLSQLSGLDEILFLSVQRL